MARVGQNGAGVHQYTQTALQLPVAEVFFREALVITKFSLAEMRVLFPTPRLISVQENLQCVQSSFSPC